MTNLKQYLENLKALEARATPGNLWVIPRNVKYGDGFGDPVSIPEIVKRFDPEDGNDDYHLGADIGGLPEPNRASFRVIDACLLAASRNALPILIAALEETVGALEIFKESITPDGCGGYHWRDDAVVDAMVFAEASLEKVNALIGEAK